MLSISSPHNPRLKRALKLRSRRGRHQQGRYLIDGIRELRRCLAERHELQEVFVCSTWIESTELAVLQEEAHAARAVVIDLPASLFAKLAYGDRSDGVVASATRFTRSLDSLSLPANPLIVLIESLEKPGNVGAILRSADAAGADAVVHVSPQTDWFNPNTIRASTGAVFTMAYCDAEPAAALAWLKTHSVQAFTARPDAERCYTAVDYRGPTAIVLGSEAQGLSDDWRDDSLTGIQIPMRGKVVDSLNVSVTAAVILFEAQRQRRCASS